MEWDTSVELSALFSFEHTNRWTSYVGTSVYLWDAGDIELDLIMGTELRVVERLYFGLDYLYNMDPGDSQLVDVDLWFRYEVF